MQSYLRKLDMQKLLLSSVFLLIAGCKCAIVGLPNENLDSFTSNTRMVLNTRDEDDPCLGFCMYGGTCTLDENNNPVCHCLPGLNGTHCEQHPCMRFPCYNGGNCQYLPNWPPEYAQCMCPDNFTGVHCQLKDTCGSKNITCGDYGQCVNDDTETGYKCYCQPGHAGDNCQIEDKCYPNPCQHEGLCYLDNDINNENGFNCYCKTGYHGDTCQIGDPCANYECFNGGTCEWDSDWQPVCQCTYKFEGPHCKLEVNCTLECINEGICAKDHNGNTKCFCPQGYSGEQCEKDLCGNYGCYNGGTCSINKDGNPICTCRPGYNGTKCDENVCQGYTECTKQGNHGMCEVNDGGQPHCVCKDGWTGEFCDKEETKFKWFLRKMRER